MTISKLTKLEPVADKLGHDYDHSKLEELVDENFTTYLFDGRSIVKDNNTGEYLDYILMSDQYFYDNWITQFAIGEVAGKNYFDMTTWSNLTEQFTKGVIIVHEETNQFLFLIPKFIEPNYTPNIKNVINRVLSIGARISFHHDAAEKSKSIHEMSKIFTDLSNKDKPNQGVTGLIPDVIYQFYGINPKAFKAAIYTRDHYKTVLPDTDEFKRLTTILTAHFEGRPVTEQDRQFVYNLTHNEFVFENITPNNTERVIKQSIQNDEFDPLAD